MSAQTQFGRRENRQFALLMAIALPLLLGWFGRWQWSLWALPVSALLLGLAWLRPSALTGANRAWHRLGILLGRIVTPLLMSLVFVLAVVPLSLIRRLLGKRSFALRPDPAAASYWQPRAQDEPSPEQLRNQF